MPRKNARVIALHITTSKGKGGWVIYNSKGGFEGFASDDDRKVLYRGGEVPGSIRRVFPNATLLAGDLLVSKDVLKMFLSFTRLS